MGNKLTLHPYMLAGNGPLHGGGEPVAYDVRGLAPGHEARIAKIDYTWKILKTIGGVSGEWQGEFQTPDEALASVEGAPAQSTGLSTEADIIRTFPLHNRHLLVRGRGWRIALKGAWPERDDPSRVHMSLHLKAIGDDEGPQIRVTIPTHLLVECSDDPVTAVIIGIEKTWQQPQPPGVIDLTK